MEHLWSLGTSSKESLHIWQNFVRSGYGDKTFVHAARESHLTKPLVDYFVDVRSTSFAWMTDLTLCNLDCSSLDLKSIGVLCNLQNLQILYTKLRPERHPFNDGVLEFLGSQASTDGAFTRLEMIFVQGGGAITAQAFKYLNQFPVLDCFCVFQTDVRPKHSKLASQHGWVKYFGQVPHYACLEGSLYANNLVSSAFSTYLKQYELRRAYDGSLACANFHNFADGYIHKRRSESSNTRNNVPILDVHFSGPATNFDPSITEYVILCFERDWRFIRPEPAVKLSEATGERLAASATAKKRKLRDGKGVVIDTLLQTF